MTPPADGWPPPQDLSGGQYPAPGSAYQPSSPQQTTWGTPIVEAPTDQLARPLDQPVGPGYESQPPVGAHSVTAAAAGAPGPEGEPPPPAHRSSDRSLVYPGVAKSVVGGLIAIAVILTGIVATNALLKDDEPTSSRLLGGTGRSSSASAGGTSSEGSATDAKSGTSTPAQPAAKKPAKRPAKAAAKPAAKPATKPVAKPATKPAPQATAEAAPPAAAADPTPPEAVVRSALTVLNSSRIRNLATSAAGDFRAAGWAVPEGNVGNTRFRVGVTTVYYLPGQEAAARQVMRDIPGVQRMRLRPRSLPGKGLTVVVTREYAS